MGRARQRADRIRREIPIAQVLADYGYAVHADYDGEQQYSCDLHGDGTDNKPSARVYPDSNSTYCFACDRTRDAIQLVREKEGVDFWAAVRLLEKRYGLGHLDYEDDEEAPTQEAPETGILAKVSAEIDSSVPYEKVAHRTKVFLDGLTLGRDLPLDTILRLWEAYDKVDFYHSKGMLTEDKSKAGMELIRQRAFVALKARMGEM